MGPKALNDLIERILNPVLGRVDGLKTLIGLLGLLVLWVLGGMLEVFPNAAAVAAERADPTQQTAVDWANYLWATFVVMAGLGVANKDAKRVANSPPGR